MELHLKGKQALVLAASAGLGYATALELAREGAQVALCSRSFERAQAAAHAVQQDTGQSVLPFQADVGDAAQLGDLFAQLSGVWDGLDILVCNAGGPPTGSFRDLSPAQWDATYELTLLSVVRSVRLALPLLTARGGGRILTISSSSVKRPIENLTLSNVFRPAVQGLVKTLSLELGPDNIQVNALAPGQVLTARLEDLQRHTAQQRGLSLEEVKASATAAVPMGRLGDPAEFGRVAAFLCSPAASYVNGSYWLVDGGAVTNLG